MARNGERPACRGTLENTCSGRSRSGTPSAYVPGTGTPWVSAREIAVQYNYPQGTATQVFDSQWTGATCTGALDSGAQYNGGPWISTPEIADQWTYPPQTAAPGFDSQWTGATCTGAIESGAQYTGGPCTDARKYSAQWTGAPETDFIWDGSPETGFTRDGSPDTGFTRDGSPDTGFTWDGSPDTDFTWDGSLETGVTWAGAPRTIALTGSSPVSRGNPQSPTSVRPTDNNLTCSRLCPDPYLALSPAEQGPVSAGYPKDVVRCIQTPGCLSPQASCSRLTKRIVEATQQGSRKQFASAFSAVVSTVMTMAYGDLPVPDTHKQWTKKMLNMVRDGQGKFPPNVAGILWVLDNEKSFQKDEPEEQITDEQETPPQSPTDEDPPPSPEGEHSTSLSEERSPSPNSEEGEDLLSPPEERSTTPSSEPPR